MRGIAQMTTITIQFDGANYTLTDEASQSSYGEPVLVCPCGTQMRGVEVVVTQVIAGDALFADEVRTILARDVANEGAWTAVTGEAFRHASGDLTDYGYAASNMFARFMRQVAGA